MPNWCENQLRVTGPAEELDRFRQAVSSEGTEGASALDFETLLPTPPELLSEEAERPREVSGVLAELTGAVEPKDWYTWRVQNWATKWPAASVRLTSNGSDLIYDFDTAWSPPVAWVEKAAALFPALEMLLFWAEAGVGACGRSSFEGGKLVSQREVEGGFAEGSRWLEAHGLHWWEGLAEMDEE